MLTDVQDLIDKRLVHELHTSERKSFRGCRRRWHWIFKDMWYPSTTAKPLEFGVAFHAAMETLYDPNTWDWPRGTVLQLAKVKFQEVNIQQLDLYLQTPQASMSETDPREDYAERLALAKSMLDYYGGKVMPVVDKHWTPIKVEVEFVVPIQNPDTGV
jgi:hypothetical protein